MPERGKLLLPLQLDLGRRKAGMEEGADHQLERRIPILTQAFGAETGIVVSRAGPDHASKRCQSPGEGVLVQGLRSPRRADREGKLFYPRVRLSPVANSSEDVELPGYQFASRNPLDQYLHPLDRGDRHV